MKNYMRICRDLTSIVLCMLGIEAQATLIFGTAFDSGTVGTTFRVYESTINDGSDGNAGWRKAIAGGNVESEWTIAGGVAANSSSVAATGYPNSKAAEAPLYNFFESKGTVETNLRLRFDYSVPNGDKLYAHLWGMTGMSNNGSDFVSNIEGSANGNVNFNGAPTYTGGLTTYNLTDGAASGFGGIGSAISGELTGTGSFDLSFNIASLGIPGVTTAGDINYYLIQFAQQEDGLPGTLTIDNFSLTAVAAVPEPTAFALLGCGFAIIRSIRRRGKKTIV